MLSCVTQDEPLSQRLLAVAPAARYLGMSPRALRARVYRREIPIVRVGRRIFFDRARLEQWITDHSDEVSIVRGPWEMR